MGALTLKPFSNESREWELFENESIDITDGFGNFLRLSIRENQVFLVEPYCVDNPWITDRSRLFFEGYFESNDDLNDLNWSVIFDQIISTVYFLDHLKFIKSNIETQFLTIVFKRLCDENLDVFNKLENNFSIIKLRTDNQFLSNVNLEESYQINSSFDFFKLKFSSLAVLIGINTRYEGCSLNLVLRQKFLKGNFNILSLGPLLNLTIPCNYLSSNIRILHFICEGTSYSCRELINSTMPVFLTNFHFLKQIKYSKLNDMLAILKNAGVFWGGLSVMTDKIEKTGINDFQKYKPLTAQELKKSSVLYYVNMDLNYNSEFKILVQKNLINTAVFEKNLEPKVNFVFVQSDSIFDKRTNQNKEINVLEQKKMFHFYSFLPVKGFFEENSTYKNTKGKIKKTTKVLNYYSNTKSNWQLLRYMHFSFSKYSFFSQKKDSTLLSNMLKNQLNQSNYYHFLDKTSVSLSIINSFLEPSSTPFFSNSEYFLKHFKNFKFCFKNSKIKHWLNDFFVGGNKDNLSVNSSTLLKCSAVLRSGSTNFF